VIAVVKSPVLLLILNAPKITSKGSTLPPAFSDFESIVLEMKQKVVVHTVMIRISNMF
jgi:hypothetical protein